MLKSSNPRAPLSGTKLKTAVFFLPFLLLLFSIVFSLVDPAGFLDSVRSMNDWILGHFGWLFSVSTFFFLVLCVAVYFSPLGRVRIGGVEARPILKKWPWFYITLCTTIAIGILFWATAEPIYHLNEPPAGTGIEPGSAEAARFALSAMYLHWTFTPYSIYTLAALLFALVYYNYRQPFSLGSLLYPIAGKPLSPGWSKVIDAVCLYSLVAGMAASLGAGVLTLSGGLRQFFDLENTPVLLLGITGVIVATFVFSAVSGLMKGIRILSNINFIAFLGIGLFVLLAVPAGDIFALGVEGLGSYFVNLIPRSLGIGIDKTWSESWTVFYWANWLAWAPVTAVFLGRLAVGYTVREFIRVNLLYTSLFSVLWMTIFSGSALNAGQADLYGVLQNQGPEGTIYALLGTLPFPKITGLLFLLIAFISYVTAADSNTSAMSGLCSNGISPQSPESPAWIKVVWGLIVGAVAWVMVSGAGVDGVKMASNLGGFPALFLLLGVAVGVMRLMVGKDMKAGDSN